MAKRTLSQAEWHAEATEKFGSNSLFWKFVCPSCGHIASVQDWIDAGAPEGAIAFSCVGRYSGSKHELGDKSAEACNYAGGGLFQLNPVDVRYSDGSVVEMFEFAEASHVA